MKLKSVASSWFTYVRFGVWHQPSTFMLRNPQIQPTAPTSSTISFALLWTVFSVFGTEMTKDRFEHSWHHSKFCSSTFTVTFVTCKFTWGSCQKFASIITSNPKWVEISTHCNARHHDIWWMCLRIQLTCLTSQFQPIILNVKQRILDSRCCSKLPMKLGICKTRKGNWNMSQICWHVDPLKPCDKT